MKKAKPVLIVETMNSTIKLNSTKDVEHAKNSDYEFEGEFAVLGKGEVNRNGRYYLLEEYLPHIQSLQPKIARGSLLGELDHPARFDTQLKHASHLITELKLVTNSDNKQAVRGKIKLLNTDAGRNAKALVDGGVELSISSRAAGIVESDGNVRIKKLFTYDLVNEPGFKNSQLKRINEEFGIPSDGIGIYEISESMLNEDKELQLLIESDNEFSTLIKEQFSLTDDYIHSHFSNTQIQENINIKKEKEFMLTEEKIKELIEESVSAKIASLSAKTVDTETFNRLIQYNDYLAESLNKVIADLENISESSEINKISEDIEKIKNYLDYVSDTFNESEVKLESIEENVSNLLRYSDYIAENVTNLEKYGDYVAENVNNLEHLSEQIIDYTEYLKENLEVVDKKQDKIMEQFYHKDSQTTPLQKNLGLSQISESIDKLIESSIKKEEGNANDDEMPTFLNILGEEYAKIYNSYSEHIKEALKEAFANKSVTRVSEAKYIWSKTVEPFFKVEENIPGHLLNTWQNASELTKQRILTEAKLYDLVSEKAINHFWETRNFNEQNVTMNPRFAKVKNMLTVNEDTDYSSLIEKVRSFRPL